MTIPGVNALTASIVNAVIFDLLVDIPITFIVSNSAPCTTSVGVLGTLLFVAACVVYAFPNLACIKMTKDGLLKAFLTLLRYLLPWIGLRLLSVPGNRLLCLLSTKLFSRRCHRLQFLRSVQLIFCGLCIVAILHRICIFWDIERRIRCYWRKSSASQPSGSSTGSNSHHSGSSAGSNSHHSGSSTGSNSNHSGSSTGSNSHQHHSGSSTGSNPHQHHSGSSTGSNPALRRSERKPKPKKFTCC